MGENSMYIKRYNLVLDKTGECDCGIYECNDGKYVKLEDIDKLITELYVKHGGKALKDHMKKKLTEVISDRALKKG